MAQNPIQVIQGQALPGVEAVLSQGQPLLHQPRQQVLTTVTERGLFTMKGTPIQVQAIAINPTVILIAGQTMHIQLPTIAIQGQVHMFIR